MAKRCKQDAIQQIADISTVIVVISALKNASLREKNAIERWERKGARGKLRERGREKSLAGKEWEEKKDEGRIPRSFFAKAYVRKQDKLTVMSKAAGSYLMLLSCPGVL